VPAAVQVAREPVTDGSEQAQGIGLFGIVVGGVISTIVILDLLDVINVLGLDDDDNDGGVDPVSPG
jgi:hypothetical protein